MDKRDPIAELLDSQRTPNQQVFARFPTNYELGTPDQAAIEELIAAMNGPAGIPNFSWVNPAGMAAFLESAPESENVEDRRPDPDAFIRSVLARGQ